MALGCDKANLKAKIFGGSQKFNAKTDSLKVGAQNVVVAQQILEEQKIHIVNANTGGAYGRKLYFYTDTGVIMMKLIRVINNNLL